MSLTIFGPDHAIGPGIESRTQWILDQPTAPASTWTIEVREAIGFTDQVLLRHQFPQLGAEGTVPNFLLGDPSAGTMTFPSFHFATAAGDDVRYRVVLADNAGVQPVQQAELTGVWDGSFAWKLTATGGGTSGFSPTDRTDLQIVKQSVQLNLGGVLAGGGEAIVRAIDAVSGVPRSVLSPGSSQALSGRGVLAPLIDGTGARALGATWSWFTIPAGFGFVDGQLLEYFNRIAQFLVVREGADDTLYIDEHIDTQAEGGHILWKLPAPTEIRYDIAPGAVVTWRWLI